MKKFVSIILAVMLVSSLSVVAFAKESPTATTATTTTTTAKKNTTSKDYNGGKVTVTKDPNTNEITYTFDSKSGYDFTGWNISGDYTIVSGSLESGTITIIPADGNSIKVTPSYKESSNKGTDDDDNGNNTSPKTGDATAYLILLGAIALGAVVISKKQLAK